jgi:antitoxin component of MazEF toxin-antitoxin module
MKAKLTRWGGSKGVVIPAYMLRVLGWGRYKEVELTLHLQKGEIVLSLPQKALSINQG